MRWLHTSIKTIYPSLPLPGLLNLSNYAGRHMLLQINKCKCIMYNSEITGRELPMVMLYFRII